MSKSTLGLLFFWILLVILNIVSLFAPCGFLTVCNYIFGGLNAVMVISLIPQIIEYFKDRREK